VDPEHGVRDPCWSSTILTRPGAGGREQPCRDFSPQRSYSVADFEIFCGCVVARLRVGWACWAGAGVGAFAWCVPSGAPVESWQGTHAAIAGSQRLDQRAAELKGAEEDYSARSSTSAR